MARKLRLEYPGAIYQVMNRGDRREPIFLDDEDRQRFLTALGEACAKTGWHIHALCLMTNHFHRVIEAPPPSLVAGMKWLLGTYPGRFNRRHHQFGHLFSGRYKALMVDGSGPGYLKTVCDCVHLNPARANLLGREEKLSAYRWSRLRSWRFGCGRKRPSPSNGSPNACEWGLGPTSITCYIGIAVKEHHEMQKYYKTRNRPVSGAAPAPAAALLSG